MKCFYFLLLGYYENILIISIALTGLPYLFLIIFLFIFSSHLARRQEIIKMTEQLIEAINNGDFDAYT